MNTQNFIEDLYDFFKSYTTNLSVTGIKEIMFRGSATIVFWDDGTKTVVRKGEDDNYDREKAVLWAFCIKHCGSSKTKVKKELKTLIEKGKNNENSF